MQLRADRRAPLAMTEIKQSKSGNLTGHLNLDRGETLSPKLILQQLWIDLTGKIK